ncbi:SWI/SNF complex subunit SWI3D [Apostasia shenzhenica]|uniref:SWI/SNF complex subunit SWI3D n=1 Tax=Apostasia shenzhenica TaxID=1088818 RepID=A0A2I0AWB3_9ASPA|nr:SWI/SNF complex subunit SWI3D [Apostasia shenzhenica]
MEARCGRDPPMSQASSEAKPTVAIETLAEGSRRRAAGLKRKAALGTTAAASPSSSAPSKRLIKERTALNILPIDHNGPWTRARQPPNRFAASGSQKQRDVAAAAGTADGEDGKELLDAGDRIGFEEVTVPLDGPIVDAEFEAVRSRGAYVHVVPTPAGWFSWKKIHELEKHLLPSFFNGEREGRTAEIYMEIRNSIMKKFHDDPHSLLEVKDLSEISAGDMSARQEVMERLDCWGLINFHPFPPSNTEEGISETGATTASPLLDQLYLFEDAVSLPCLVPKNQELSTPAILPQMFSDTALIDDIVRTVDPSVEYHCNSCSADCSRKRYHCQKQADFDLCVECYNNGKFGSDMTPADFILMESAEGPGVSGGSWTDQETLLLLEALELFGENWNEIAEHVATKTKAQCILHFLQMPIEDPFLESKDDSSGKMHDLVEPYSASKEPSLENTPEMKGCDNGTSSDHPVSSPAENDAEVDQSHESNSCFAIDALKSAFHAIGFAPEEAKPNSFVEAGNPVMVLAAFFARLADQDAVAISSRSSLKAMSEETPGLMLASRHCFILADPPNDNVGLPVSGSMATDIGNLKEVDQLPSSNGCDELNDGVKNRQVDTASEQSENLLLASSHEDSKKSSVSKEPGDAFLTEDIACSRKKRSDDRILPRELRSNSDQQDKNNGHDSVIAATVNSKELGGTPSHGGDAPSHGGDALTTTKVADDLNNIEDKSLISSKSDEECLDQVQKILGSQKDAETLPTSVMKDEVIPIKDSTASTIDVSEVVGGDNKRESSSRPDINISTADSQAGINNLKRAAVSVLSAAAVKAKLLADQEEDEIRQLASFVIEKQLRKLEIKLALFSEMESVITRAKEQIERAKQKLIHERAMIIAARLGLPPPSSRPFSTSLTANKFAMGYGSTSLRLPSMASQKPPPTRRP